MLTGKKIVCVLWLGLTMAGCGQEFYSTPQKTLERYVEYRHMGNLAEITNCLECFTKVTREWWARHYMDACHAKFGTFSSLCGESKVDQANIWGGLIEESGPTTAEVESSNINEADGSAVLRVQGKDIYFIREGKNWKIDGFFGADDALTEQYPQLKN
jgi:hypothetical protein